MTFELKITLRALSMNYKHFDTDMEIIKKIIIENSRHLQGFLAKIMDHKKIKSNQVFFLLPTIHQLFQLKKLNILTVIKL